MLQEARKRLVRVLVSMLAVAVSAVKREGGNLLEPGRTLCGNARRCERIPTLHFIDLCLGRPGHAVGDLFGHALLFPARILLLLPNALHFYLPNSLVRSLVYVLGKKSARLDSFMSAGSGERPSPDGSTSAPST